MRTVGKLATVALLLLLGWYILLAILRIQKIVPTPAAGVVTIVSILTLPLVALAPGYLQQQKGHYAVGFVVGTITTGYVAYELSRAPSLPPLRGLAPPVIHLVLSLFLAITSLSAYGEGRERMADE